jgi:nitric oxide reductase subunit C
MLSKSQARAFFLGGTLLFAAIFIGLTIDTISQNDKRTNSHNLTDSVKRGKEIWEKNNCMGCHTLLGEGAYYAPDLTKVVERRGEEWIKIFINDPQAMFPGERKMVKYNFTEEEKKDIIAFLKWVGEIDSNGWPPKPNIEMKSSSTATTLSITNPTQPMPQKVTQICLACHAIGGKGGNVGSALDKVGTKYDIGYLAKWLNDPQAVKPGTAMPKLPLAESELTEIVQFLSSLK